MAGAVCLGAASLCRTAGVAETDGGRVDRRRVERARRENRHGNQAALPYVDRARSHAGLNVHLDRQEYGRRVRRAVIGRVRLC